MMKKTDTPETTEETTEPNIETKSITQKHWVDLTDSELLQHGSELAECYESQARKDEEEKEIKAQLKAEREAITAKINKLSRLVNGKREYRDVDCRLVKDFEHGKITTIRLDTMEEVEERTMSSGERQMGLKVDEEVNKAVEKAVETFKDSGAEVVGAGYEEEEPVDGDYGDEPF